MPNALIGEANFVANRQNAPIYRADVMYEGAANLYTQTQIEVPVQAGDTPAVFQTRLLAAIDTEAARLGVATPTVIYGNALTKFR